MAVTFPTIELMIHEAMDRLRSRGYIRAYRLFHQLNSDDMKLECRLHSGEPLLYRLTGMELVNSDPDSIEFWLQTIEQDIRWRSERLSRQGLRNCVSGSDSWFQQQYLQASFPTNEMLAQQQALTSQQIAQNQAIFYQGLRSNYLLPDPKANEKAEELFMLACGKEAFDTLNSGRPLPVTGSKGTEYTLHKRSTYCVERVSDNARLCAVVPSVPLWDHLLGIKLMIEHDEPKFLETANVAQNFPAFNQNQLNALAQNVTANNGLLNRLRQALQQFFGGVVT